MATDKVERPVEGAGAPKLSKGLVGMNIRFRYLDNRNLVYSGGVAEVVGGFVTVEEFLVILIVERKVVLGQVNVGDSAYRLLKISIIFL